MYRDYTWLCLDDSDCDNDCILDYTWLCLEDSDCEND